ncbi:unnamed protein product [Closterium sp. NIES-65]|nr:unnamed protein product [Closterium sp. NIES-65]
MAAPREVFVIGTMDTKSEELLFLVSQLKRSLTSLTTAEPPFSISIIDVSASPSSAALVTSTTFPTISVSDALASNPGAAAKSAASLAADRGEAVQAVSDALKRFVRGKWDAGVLAGAAGIGGSGGTAIIAPALRELPVGVPKIIVSTVASGNTAPYVGTSDLLLLPSVADVAGLNAILRAALSSAAAALAGMLLLRALPAAQPPSTALPSSAPVTVGITMFGVTTRCVTEVQRLLGSNGSKGGKGGAGEGGAGGVETVVFHATGTGGRAMEENVASGLIQVPSPYSLSVLPLRTPSPYSLSVLLPLRTPSPYSSLSVLPLRTPSPYSLSVLPFLSSRPASLRSSRDRGAVLDITTTEVADFIVGGTMPCLPTRFDAAIHRKVPLVLSLGALDMVNFGEASSVPKEFDGRTLHVHNPQVTLMRTTADENRRIAQFIAGKMNQSEAPVTLLIPEGGLSALDAPGMAFWDPAADAALFEELEKQVVQTDSRKVGRGLMGVKEIECGTHECNGVGGLSALDAPGVAFWDPAADAALFEELEKQVVQTDSRKVGKVKGVRDGMWCSVVLFVGSVADAGLFGSLEQEIIRLPHHINDPAFAAALVNALLPLLPSTQPHSPPPPSLPTASTADPSAPATTPPPAEPTTITTTSTSPSPSAPLPTTLNPPPAFDLSPIPWLVDRRTAILDSLRFQVAAGRAIIGGGAGTGISAKCEEMGGVDLIVIYNSGRFRMAGRGSLAGLLPFADANAVVEDMAKEVLPVIKSVPVLAGVCATDPFRQMPLFLRRLASLGFAGVQNFPTVGLYDGSFRTNLEETNMGYPLEVSMIKTASLLGFLTTPYAFNEEEARSMAGAGADVVVAHMGLTAAGSIGARTVCSLEEAVGRVQRMADAARGVNPNVLVLCHGGPISGPQEARYILQNTRGVHGFYGASSMERLPVETAITENLKAYKAIRLSS